MHQRMRCEVREKCEHILCMPELVGAEVAMGRPT